MSSFNGPTTTIDEEFLPRASSPFQIMQKFVDEEMIREIISQSQVYVSQVTSSHPKAFKNWKPFELGEFWPATVLLYNSRMGGVDGIDQMISPYRSSRKTRKWYRKVFFHLLDTTMYNSFRAFTLLNPDSKVKYKDFILNVIYEILKTYPSPSPKRGRPTISKPVQGAHFPVKILKENGKPSKTKCSACRKYTPYQCTGCMKRYCIKEKGTTSCFYNCHMKRSRFQVK